MAAEFPKDEFAAHAYGTEAYRRDGGEFEILSGLRVAAEGEGGIVSGPPPERLLAERHVKLAKLHAHVHLERPEPVRFVDSHSGQNRVRIGIRDKGADRLAVSAPARRMLILAANVGGEPARSGKCRNARDIIKALIVRPPVVVNKRLAEMVAVAQRRAANPHKPRIDRFHPNLFRNIAVARELRL